MGHNITNRDQQHGLKQAWHRLTRVKEKIDPNDNYLTSWDVERRTLSFEVDGEDVDSGFDILVGSDDDQLIGQPMSKAYKEISNESFMDLVSDAMNRLPKAKLESVGSVSNRGKVFATISLSDHKDYNIGDRKFQDFLNFGNAHDQSSRLWINNTNICTVCENTFNFNLRSNEGLVGSAVHRGDVELKLADLTVLVDEFLGTQEDFKTKFDKLLQRRIDLEKAQQLYTGFLTRNNPRERASARCLNTVERLGELFTRGAGNRGENYADAFSAVTDYYTHSSTRGGGKNKASQYYSSEHGLGRMNKNAFWTVVNNRELCEKTIQRGKKFLDLASIN